MKIATLLVLDTIEGRLSAQSLELIGFAAAIGTGDTARTALFLPGRDVAALGAELAETYGLAVVVCEDHGLHYPNPDLLRRLLRETVNESDATLVCFLHTMRNCQTAAGLSVLLGAASITAVDSCAVTEEGATFQRSVMNGKLRQSIRPTTTRTIVTILPGAFGLPDGKRDGGRPGLLYRKSSALATGAYHPLEICRETETGANLEDAEVVIAAGRGIGKKENLALVEAVARLFPNAAVGASRPLCDQKWLPYSRQVGVTGKTIAPRLYLACGISGASQHLAGMKGAHCIVAINIDPQAAIFAVADYVIVADLREFLPLLLKKYHNKAGVLAED